jgi:hypothetical protein
MNGGRLKLTVGGQRVVTDRRGICFAPYSYSRGFILEVNMRIKVLSVACVLLFLISYGNVDVLAASVQVPASAAPSAASFPFSDGFEATGFGANWSTDTLNNGVAQLSTDYPHGGIRNVFLGQKVTGAATASVILTINLLNQPDVFLDFWWRASGNVPEAINGVYIRENDSDAWKQISELDANSHSYSHELINLYEAASASGKTLSSNFQIRISFYATFFNSVNDGLVLDDLRLTRRAELIAAFPLARNSFEATTFPKGFYPRSTNNGVVQFSTDYPHSEARNVFLGQKVTGAATASLILALNLTGQTDVFLDFWWRSSGKAPEAINGVYISDNDGSTWKQISELDANSHSYSHELINLYEAASAKGLALNSKFQIRISFYATFFNSANDGLVLDDLRLTRRAELIATFPLAQNSFESPIFPQGFYPRSTNNGVAQIGTDYPHSGARSVFLGQKVAGAATASLILAINLSGRPAVFLDFWWRASGNAPEAINGVYISDDDGATWKQIYKLNANSSSYRHEVINLAEEASANGLALNNKFQVSIEFHGTFFSAVNDGLVLDDLRVGSTDPSSVKVYLPLLKR